MSSLFQLIFETMPGEGALTAAMLADHGVATMGSLATHMEWVDDADAASIAVDSPEVSQADIDAASSDSAAHALQLWSYKASALHEVGHLTCRVRDEGYKEYVVLDKVAFGSSPDDDASQFAPSVRVALAQGMGPPDPIELPLSEPFRVATFKTTNGTITGRMPLWPLPSNQDVGLLHVFVFDYNVFTGAVEPLTARAPDDPDRADLAKFREAAKRLHVGADGGDDSVLEALCADNLFQPMNLTSEAAAVAELLLGGGSAMELVLTAASIRIVVMCTLTLCKESSDYSPGGAGGSARLYPHILTRSTVPLSSVSATIQMQRPSATKIVGGGSCSCSEMKEEIRPLLVTDADSGNEQDVLPMAPSIFWNSLFNYYYAIDDPKDGFYGVGIRAARVDGRSRDTGDGPQASPMIERRLSRNRSRVTRALYQGEFDNIHLAPRMSLKTAWSAKVGEKSVPLSDLSQIAAWRLDSIPMAPFCVHDCFHMHWRWADFADRSQFGFMPKGVEGLPISVDGVNHPNLVAGATMVPPNQDVTVWLLNPSGFNYACVAHDAALDEWQVFCHHGAGYAVHVGTPMNMSRQLDLLDFAIRSRLNDNPTGDSSNVTFFDAAGDEIKPSASWAAFYWHIHYCFDGDPDVDLPRERTVIKDLRALRAF